MNYITDSDRIEFLERQNAKAVYTGKCLFRQSSTGRGWRLHESSGGPRSEKVHDTVRQAIDHAMRLESQNSKQRTNEHQMDGHNA